MIEWMAPLDFIPKQMDSFSTWLLGTYGRFFAGSRYKIWRSSSGTTRRDPGTRPDGIHPFAGNGRSALQAAAEMGDEDEEVGPHFQKRKLKRDSAHLPPSCRPAKCPCVRPPPPRF